MGRKKKIATESLEGGDLYDPFYPTEPVIDPPQDETDPVAPSAPKPKTRSKAKPKAKAVKKHGKAKSPTRYAKFGG
jgi:hypothetical protein